MTDFVFLDGRLVPHNEARISIDDRTVLYGDGVFETIRTYQGTPFRLDRHLDRLSQGCARLRIDRPPNITTAVEETLRANELDDAVVRITVTGGRSSGPTGLERTGPPSLLITTARYEPRPVPPIRLAIASIRRDPSSPLSSIKSTNYMDSLLAKQEAIDARADDALLLTPDGAVSEATSSNVFWVTGGALFTPGLDCGLLPGVTREAVLEIADGIECRQVSDGLQAVLDADEVFVTNSLVEIMPVSRVADRAYLAPGPLTTLLHTRYRKLVSEST